MVEAEKGFDPSLVHTGIFAEVHEKFRRTVGQRLGNPLLVLPTINFLTALESAGVSYKPSSYSEFVGGKSFPRNINEFATASLKILGLTPEIDPIGRRTYIEALAIEILVRARGEEMALEAVQEMTGFPERYRRLMGK